MVRTAFHLSKGKDCISCTIDTLCCPETSFVKLNTVIFSVIPEKKAHDKIKGKDNKQTGNVSEYCNL